MTWMDVDGQMDGWVAGGTVQGWVMDSKDVCMNGHQFYSMSAIDIPEQGPKSKLRSTGSSLFYRAVGRQTKAAWGNRIVKDFYDLDYNVPTTSFRIDKFSNTAKQQHRRLREDIERSKFQRRKAALPQHTQQSQIAAEKSKTLALRVRRKSLRENPQRIEVGALSGASSKVQGLCPFEFSKTIQGRMERRLNHHISFEKNRSRRIVNEHPIHYDRHKDIDFSHAELMQSRRTIAAFHSFSSYSERRVFEPREELDKIFDTDSARQGISPKRLKEAVRQFERVLERKEALAGESSRLTYETLPVALGLKRKAVSYSISQSERETYFSPEVISPKRGCFR